MSEVEHLQQGNPLVNGARTDALGRQGWWFGLTSRGTMVVISAWGRCELLGLGIGAVLEWVCSWILEERTGGRAKDLIQLCQSLDKECTCISLQLRLQLVTKAWDQIQLKKLESSSQVKLQPPEVEIFKNGAGVKNAEILVG